MKRNINRFVLILTLLAIPVILTAQARNQDILPTWAFGGFVRPANVNPVISPKTDTKFLDPMSNKQVAWEANYTFNPGAVVKDGKVIVLYRAEDMTGVEIGTRTSRLGYAESTDGIHFTRNSTPVLYPGNDSQKEYEWPGGCEDPRVAVTEDGTYVVFYTQWNRKVPRLGVATSKDLINWTKHGPVFKKAYNGKFCDTPHKSASIITKLAGDRQIIAKISGKYWMYWGETNVYAATSTNLVDWQPLVDKNTELTILFSPRKGYFDSHLTECGPPSIMTDKGIILFYNGRNLPGDEGDKRYNALSYCAGQALFDKNDPAKFISRLDVPFLRPMESFEKSGQYVQGTVFIEGLVYFKNKWFLYYGCADSKVGVAIYDPAKVGPPDPVIL
jgi:beta-1,2-mannosidase